MSLFSTLSISSRRHRKTAKLDLANGPKLAVETLGKREMLSVTWSSFGYPANLSSPWSSGSSYTRSATSYGVGGSGYGSSSFGSLFGSTSSYGSSSYTSPSTSYSSYTPSLTTTPFSSRSSLTITPYSPSTTSQLTITPLYQSANRTYNPSFNGAGNIFGTNSGPRTSPPSQLQSPSRFGDIFTTRPSGPTSVPPLAPYYKTTSPSYTSPSYTSSTYITPTYQGVGQLGSTTSIFDSSFFDWGSPTTSPSTPSRFRTGSVDYDFGSSDSGWFGSGSTSGGSSSSLYRPGNYYRQNGVDFYYKGTNADGTPSIDAAWIQPNGSRFRVTENSVIQTHGAGGFRYF